MSLYQLLKNQLSNIAGSLNFLVSLRVRLLLQALAGWIDWGRFNLKIGNETKKISSEDNNENTPIQKLSRFKEAIKTLNGPESEEMTDEEVYPILALITTEARTLYFPRGVDVNMGVGLGTEKMGEQSDDPVVISKENDGSFRVSLESNAYLKNIMVPIGNEDAKNVSAQQE